MSFVPLSILAADPKSLSRVRLSASSLRLGEKDAFSVVAGHGDETGTFNMASRMKACR